MRFRGLDVTWRVWLEKDVAKLLAKVGLRTGGLLYSIVSGIVWVPQRVERSLGQLKQGCLKMSVLSFSFNLSEEHLIYLKGPVMYSGA